MREVESLRDEDEAALGSMLLTTGLLYERSSFEGLAIRRIDLESVLLSLLGRLDAAYEVLEGKDGEEAVSHRGRSVIEDGEEASDRLSRARRAEISMQLIQAPPKMVYNSGGDLVEVILSADDFRTYLRTLNAEADWDTLPRHLQDAIDRLLIDEVRGEKQQALALETVLAGNATS